MVKINLTMLELCDILDLACDTRRKREDGQTELTLNIDLPDSVINAILEDYWMDWAEANDWIPADEARERLNDERE